MRKERVVRQGWVVHVIYIISDQLAGDKSKK
jgi:hypothetical protein